jgi:hypothetical protein
MLAFFREASDFIILRFLSAPTIGESFVRLFSLEFGILLSLVSEVVGVETLIL